MPHDKRHVRSTPLEYGEPLRVLKGKGWLKLQAGRSPGFPMVCCSCVHQTTNQWPVPRLVPFAFKIPLCPNCVKRWTRIHRCWMVGVACLFAALGAVVCLVMPIGEVPAITVLIASASIGMLLAPFAAQHLGLPFWQGFWMRNQTHLWIRFRNRSFTEILDREISD